MTITYHTHTGLHYRNHSTAENQFLFSTTGFGFIPSSQYLTNNLLSEVATHSTHINLFLPCSLIWSLLLHRPECSNKSRYAPFKHRPRPRHSTFKVVSRGHWQVWTIVLMRFMHRLGWEHYWVSLSLFLQSFFQSWQQSESLQLELVNIF